MDVKPRIYVDTDKPDDVCLGQQAIDRHTHCILIR